MELTRVLRSPVHRVVLAVLLGAVAPAVSVVHGVTRQAPDLRAVVPLVALVLLCWLRPLVLFRGGSSEAMTVDEGAFVVAALMLPMRSVALVFVVASVLAQLLRRRTLMKSAFNVAVMLLASYGGAAITTVLLPADPGTNLRTAVAGIAGTVAFASANRLLVTCVLVASGDMSLTGMRDDFRSDYLTIVGGSAVIGLVAALALVDRPSLTVLALAPLGVLRVVLVGHVRAHRDRQRLVGLLDATVVITHAVHEQDVREALLGRARELLRCETAELVADSGDLHPPTTVSGIAVQIGFDENAQWLLVDGRAPGEPFDQADRTLLDALGAVGAGALFKAQAYERSRRERERLDAITRSLGEGVCAVHADGTLSFANPSALEVLGCEGLPLDAPAIGTVLAPLLRLASGVLAGTEDRREGEADLVRPDGVVVPVAFSCTPTSTEDGPSAVIAFRDVSERKAFEKELSHQAFHDALTGLPNRRVFLDRLDRAMRRGGIARELHGVLFIDVDRFKLINDSLGHASGDQLLRAIAQRLHSVLRPSDTLSRFAGDEFTILIERLRSHEDAQGLARRIQSAMREPIVLEDGRELIATVSVGIALTAGRDSADDVIHDADVAMYEAKRAGAGQWAMFDGAAMATRSADLLDVESDLRRAIDNDELEVYYQPTVDTNSRRTVGAEALVRWNCPGRGVLGPADFIAVAEETGLILPLGRQVLRTACFQAQQWTEEFGYPFQMSVNLSARQFVDKRLVEDLREALESSGLAPSQLCLEITETVAVEDTDRTLEILHGLKAQGVRLAIDDFGIGYSSLQYLKQFPLDVLKIDRAFVSEVTTNSVDSAIVAAVMALAKAVGMTTVAEGVETEEQLFRLQDLGCPYVQGYYLARPQRAAAMRELLVDTVAVETAAHRTISIT
jgi:diguanylate cyclase (GGDEF)-like protein/PAS domain S-box-containing protein